MEHHSVVHEQPTDAEIYERYAPVLLAYLLRQLATKEDAEDVLLEIFLALFQKRSILALEEQKLQYFIWTVARNKVIDYHRRKKQRMNIPLHDIDEELLEREEEAPEQVALQKEANQRLYAVMQHLPKQQREVIYLRFGHDLSCVEIATMVDKSEGAVRMLLHRALNGLRKYYTSKM